MRGVGEDGAVLGEREAGGLGEPGARRDARGEQDEVGVERAPATCGPRAVASIALERARRAAARRRLGCSQAARRRPTSGPSRALLRRGLLG